VGATVRSCNATISRPRRLSVESDRRNRIPWSAADRSSDLARSNLFCLTNSDRISLSLSAFFLLLRRRKFFVDVGFLASTIDVFAMTRSFAVRSRFNVQSSTCRPHPEKTFLPPTITFWAMTEDRNVEDVRNRYNVRWRGLRRFRNSAKRENERGLVLELKSLLRRINHDASTAGQLLRCRAPHRRDCWRDSPRARLFSAR
jgi:hypothetical protein